MRVSASYILSRALMWRIFRLLRSGTILKNPSSTPDGMVSAPDRHSRSFFMASDTTVTLSDSLTARSKRCFTTPLSLTRTSMPRQS